jgi:hypothetical protein
LKYRAWSLIAEGKELVVQHRALVCLQMKFGRIYKKDYYKVINLWNFQSKNLIQKMIRNQKTRLKADPLTVLGCSLQ